MVGSEDDDDNLPVLRLRRKIIVLSQTVGQQRGDMIHQRAAAVLIITILLYISISLLTNSNHSSISPANPLDGCTFVYLDMGTNVGVQIRWTGYLDQRLEISLQETLQTFAVP